MAFYHFKKGEPEIVGGIGDGTKTSPWYWYGKTEGQTVSVNNAGADSSDNYRLYFRVKLKGGTAYSIGQSGPGAGDGRIKLFDSAMSEVADNDDGLGSVAGISCTDVLTYTPSADGIFYIGAGAYSTATGDYQVAINPAPEQEPLPEIKYRYPTSSGFDEFGYPIAYDTASEAGCDRSTNKYPEDAILSNCDTLTDAYMQYTNCTLSTDIKKYGTGSIKINSGGYIKFDHGAGSLTANTWTVAHFFYADSYTGNAIAPLVNNDDDGQGAFFISISSDGTLRANLRGISEDYGISEVLPFGWHHLRVTHTGNGTLRVYLDGIFIHSFSGFARTTDSFWIGELGYLDSNRQFDGYIDSVEFIPLDDATIAEYSGDTAPVPYKEFKV